MATPAELPAGRFVKGLGLQTLLKVDIGTKGTSFTTYKPAVSPSWRPIGTIATAIISRLITERAP